MNKKMRPTCYKRKTMEIDNSADHQIQLVTKLLCLQEEVGLGGKKRKNKNMQLGFRKRRKMEFDKSIEDIPVHLMELVADRLCLPDLFRFSCVCKTWSSISHPLRFANHLPWLIVPLCKNEPVVTSTTSHMSIPSMAFQGTKDVGFFSVRDDRIYRLELRELFNRRICGSLPGGWLMTAHENSEIQLFNPFNCSSPSPVSLPPLTKFPQVLNTRIDKKANGVHPHMVYELQVHWVNGTVKKVDYPSNYMRDVYIRKAAMSTSSIRKGTIIMVIHHRTSSLAYYRIGGDEQAWAPATKNSQCSFRDLTYYKGKFYAVLDNGSVVVVHGLEEPHHVYPCIYIEQVVPIHQGAEEADQYYILESAGDLLVVFRYVDFPEDADNNNQNLPISPYRTVGFNVFKIELASLGIFRFPPVDWVEMDSLGEHSLFIGRNSSFSIPSSKFSGCKPNCIYFTDIYMMEHSGQTYGGHDMGVFSLEDGTVETFSYHCDPFVMPHPVWLTPNL